MKRFFKYISLITICAMIVAIGVDYALSRFLQSDVAPYPYSTWNRISEGGIDADVIVMGSSRAQVQYSPQVLDSVLGINTYNLGLSGRTFYTQSMIYDWYRLHNTKPKVWIQNIDFMSTLGIYTSTGKIEPDFLSLDIEQFYPYFYDKEYMQTISRQPFTWKEKYIPLYRYFGLLQTLRIAKENPQYKGYIGHDTRWNGDLIFDSLCFCCDDGVKELLCDHVEAAQFEGIKVVFVHAPFYNGAIENVKNLDEYYDTFDSIAKCYSIPVLDYTYSELSYDTAYFYNASHLNKRGAQLFSIMLSNDLDSLGLLDDLE